MAALSSHDDLSLKRSRMKKLSGIFPPEVGICLQIKLDISDRLLLVGT